MKYLDLVSLLKYDELVKQHMNKEYKFTNCPNCGAVITSEKCEYCGTHFNITNNNYGYASIPQ